MRSVLALCAVVLALSGCKSQKVVAVEAELAAAKARLAALEKKRQELTGKLKQLEVERRTFARQADEGELARQRLLAALAVLDGKPVPDGILLDDALRAKDADLGALAAQIVQRQLPCEDPDKPEEPDGPDCSPPELIDHCEGVDKTLVQGFDWTCREVIKGGRLPAVALCDSSAVLAANDFPVPVTTRTVQGDVVRVMFERQGRLVVGDWPPPAERLYRPENTSELAVCGDQNDVEACVRACDERFHRLSGGCDDWEGHPDFDDSEESDEPAELVQARRAAAAAEAEAERARDELAYQECLAPCEGAEPVEPEDPAMAALEFRRSPAPGVFEFQSQVTQPEDGGIVLHSWVLSFPAMFEAADGTLELPKEDTVLPVETELAVDHLVEGEVAPGKKVLAGVTFDGRPAGIEVTLDGSASPVVPPQEELCAFAAKQRHQPLLDACARNPVTPPAPAADAGGAP